MSDRAQNALIIKILGAMTIIGLIGIVVLDVLRFDTDAVQIIVSACVGALAAKLNADADQRPDSGNDDDEMEVLGRAFNRQLVAQFLREASDEGKDQPKK